MSIYDKQKELLKQKLLILDTSVCDIDGVKIVPPSVLKSIVKVLYDIDHSTTKEGKYILYITLKKEYEKYGFDTEFHAEVPGDAVDRLDIFDPEDRESVQFSMALLQFSELEFIENMYLDLVEAA